MTTQASDIQEFLAGPPFVVVGASNNREKYGAKVLAAYLQSDLPVHPVNPREATVQGLRCYASVRDVPPPIGGVSIITPPAVTPQVVEDCIAAGARAVWMQPGAENPQAIERARQAGLRVIANGPCILVALRYREPA